MASSEDSKSGISKKIDESAEDNYTYVHVRIDQDTKNDLMEYANKNSTSMTSVITALVEDMLYKRDDDEDDDEDELLDLIVTSLMNLERRMEIRLATLQDTFNSLIGRLIDTQQTMGTPSQIRKKVKGDDSGEGEAPDFADILSVDKEEEVYKRIKRFLQQQGTTVDLKTAIQQIEVDRSLKDWLDAEDKKAPGWKEALIADAIQEAALELGYPMLDTI